jgi:hypothetical protein
MKLHNQRLKTVVSAGVSLLMLLLLATLSPASAQSAPQTWMQLSPTGISPEGRVVGTGGAYDAVNDRLIIFSGGRNPESIPRSPDVLVLTNATGAGGTPSWIQLSPSGSGPDGRFAHTVVYDPTSNRIIVHGGCLGNCSPALADVWVLTNANGIGGTPTWIQLPSAPVERDFHVSVYDSVSNRMIVFGGQTGFHFTERNDVWILKDANGIGNPEWQQLTPQGAPPTPRVYASGVYDPASNTLIVFGGTPSSYYETTTNDAWILSNANGLGGTSTWTQLSPAGTLPSARSRHSAVYDPNTNKMLVFGGTDGTAARFNDVWELTGANGVAGTPEWRQLAPTGCPPLGRVWASVGYAPSSHQLIVAMGRGDDNLYPFYFNDVWVLKDGVGTGCGTNTPPTITVNNVTLKSNTTGGRTLVFSDIGSASDAEDGTPSVSCSPAIGSVLPLGPTVVTCTATDSGGVSTTASGTVTVVTTITMGPQAMEGDLKVSAGDTLQVGYDFTMPGSHPATSVRFVEGEVTFPYTCVGSVGSGSFMAPIVDQSYSDPANSSAWYPSGDQHSSAVFQGSFVIPSTLCGSGLVRLNQGGAFSSGVTASPAGYKVNVRWHYRANGSAGGWSGTKSIMPN